MWLSRRKIPPLIIALQTNPDYLLNVRLIKDYTNILDQGSIFLVLEFLKFL